jgi:hypothetical protein
VVQPRDVRSVQADDRHGGAGREGNDRPRGVEGERVTAATIEATDA